MIPYSTLPEITGGRLLQLIKDQAITRLVTDSRKALVEPGSLFLAIAGRNNNGHDFIGALYAAGIRQFIIEQDIDVSRYSLANIIQVDSTLSALQRMAAFHRDQLSIPVVGITGSNGKTIIKEWLYQLLSRNQSVFKTPGSYNSQIGVPLSVWQIASFHDIALIEAGISRPGEMKRLHDIVKPTIGICTNIGSAHDEGFVSIEEKITEKLKLFEGARTLIYCRDHHEIDCRAGAAGVQHLLTWGSHPDSDIRIEKRGGAFLVYTAKGNGELKLPFSGEAAIENCFHCIALLLHLNFSLEEIQSRLHSLRTVPMRLELKEGINRCQLIDDTYNNDLGGLQIALDFLNHLQQRAQKMVILSDILQSGLEGAEMVKAIGQLVSQSRLSSFIGIGPALKQHAQLIDIPGTCYSSTEEFLEQFNPDQFEHQLILVKGARSFGFERVVQLLQRKLHGTVMEIDLGAIVHNLNFFRAKLGPGVRIMAMVKAFAYGSGSVEVANLLAYHHVDYLGVAYADEGVELRQNLIRLPILVMSPSPETFGKLLTHDLEPEVYSFKILHELIAFLNGRSCTIHIKLDTGMHRLGFGEPDLSQLFALLKESTNLHVVSVFSHLAGADEPGHDAYTHAQAARFYSWASELVRELGHRPLLHLLNTAGSLRFPKYHFDMVRIGIGLYGIAGPDSEGLLPVVTLKTFITQLRDIQEGETVGYGRQGKAKRKTRIATIAAGYADGYSRAFSHGVGEVWIRGKRAPIFGSVCMDMSMVDVTDIDAREGDEVILYGREIPLMELASRTGTIPYEILTNTGDRVKRVFWAESI